MASFPETPGYFILCSCGACNNRFECHFSSCQFKCHYTVILFFLTDHAKALCFLVLEGILFLTWLDVLIISCHFKEQVTNLTGKCLCLFQSQLPWPAQGAIAEAELAVAGRQQRPNATWWFLVGPASGLLRYGAGAFSATPADASSQHVHV